MYKHNKLFTHIHLSSLMIRVGPSANGIRAKHGEERDGKLFTAYGVFLVPLCDLSTHRPAFVAMTFGIVHMFCNRSRKAWLCDNLELLVETNLFGFYGTEQKFSQADKYFSRDYKLLFVEFTTSFEWKVWRKLVENLWIVFTIPPLIKTSLIVLIE